MENCIEKVCKRFCFLWCCKVYEKNLSDNGNVWRRIKRFKGEICEGFDFLSDCFWIKKSFILRVVLIFSLLYFN